MNYNYWRRHSFSLKAVFFLLLVVGYSSYSATILKQFSSPKSIGGIVSDGSNLWMATSGGALKFNLSTWEKKIFSDLSDLPDPNLVSAIKDNSGDIWFGSADGYLTKLHPATEAFTSYNALAATGWPITCMLFFKNNIFIGCPSGLSVFSIEKGSFQNIRLFGSFTSVDVSALRSFGDTVALVTSDGIAYCVIHDIQSTILSDPSLWTCIASPGAHGIIHQNDSLTAFPRKVLESNGTVWVYGDANNLLANGNAVGSDFHSPVSCLVVLDNNKSFAAGTENSYFWLYNASTNSFTQILLDGPSDSRIESCVFDQNGLLWYVPFSMADGICQFNGTTWTQLNYKTNSDIGFMDAGTLTDRNTIMATQKNNDIWVSTFAWGVKWFNRQTGKWSSYQDHYSPLYTDASPLARFNSDTTLWWTLISGSCEDSLGYIWVANKMSATGAILNVRKPRENTWRTFSIGDTAYNLLSLYTGPIASNQNRTKDSQYVYLGYVHTETQSGGGFSVLSYGSSDSPLTGAVHCVNSDASHVVSVSDIAVANDTLAWLACGDGIYKMTNHDPNTIAKIAKITSSDGFYAVTAGYGGRAVFCKDRDLYAYDDSDTTLTKLTNFGRFGTSVNCILLDKKNSVYWVASNKGLFRFESGDSTAAKGGNALDVYPNPMSSTRLKNGHVIRFSGLDPTGPSVRIFDASGTLVTNLSDKNTRIIVWTGVNQSGKTVVPGVYFYQANIGNGKYAKGKIFIIP